MKTSFKQLIIRGIGYKSWQNYNRINFDLGFTHYISVSKPKLLQFIIRKTKLTIYSKDNQKTNNFNMFIKNLKLPDSYKGKGIRQINENIKLKTGKVRQ